MQLSSLSVPVIHTHLRRSCKRSIAEPDIHSDPSDATAAAALFVVPPTIDSVTGELSVTAVAAALAAGGTASYSVTLVDDGGTDSGGSNSVSMPTAFTLIIAPAGIAPPVPPTPPATAAFPLWVIGVVAGILFFLIVFIIIWRRRPQSYPLPVEFGTRGDTCASFYLAPTQVEVRQALEVLKMKIAPSPPGMSAPKMQPASFQAELAAILSSHRTAGNLGRCE